MIVGLIGCPCPSWGHARGWAFLLLLGKDQEGTDELDPSPEELVQGLQD